MKTIIFIFLISLTIDSGSQIMPAEYYPQQLWKAEFGGEGLEDMVVDNAGNIYVTGSVSGDNYDWVTIKYSPSGERLWFAGFGESDADIPHAIVVDNLGYVYVTGESDYITTDILTIKYNSQGVKQWEKRYATPGQDIGYDIVLDENRNIFITGSTVSGGKNDCVTLKYTSGGTLVWDEIYNGSVSGHDKGTEIGVASDGSIFVGGVTETETAYDYLMLKYSNSGVLQYVRKVDGLGHGNDGVRKMVIGGNNAIYLTGYSVGSGTEEDYMTVKYGSNGSLIWNRRYNGPVNGEDRGQSLAVDESNNVYVTGYSMSNTGLDYATVKYNSSGTFQWLAREDGGSNSDDYAKDITIDDDGDIYVTGENKRANDYYRMATVKYSPSGTRKWLKNLDYPEKVTEGRFIHVDGSENIVIGGMSDLTGSGHGWHEQFLVVKYTQSPYVIQNRNELPEAFSLSQNYPNPFNPVTNIKFDIPNASNVKLTVFDITGREIVQLVNNQLEAGTYSINFDASQLASGTYFYRIEAGDFTEVKKMLLVK